MKTSTEELLSRSRYFSTHHQTFQNSYIFNKATSLKEAPFQKNYFFREPRKQDLFFQENFFLRAATFSKQLLFYNIIFQKRQFFTTLLSMFQLVICDAMRDFVPNRATHHIQRVRHQLRAMLTWVFCCRSILQKFI